MAAQKWFLAGAISDQENTEKISERRAMKRVRDWRKSVADRVKIICYLSRK
jgi:hypothetical protein